MPQEPTDAAAIESIKIGDYVLEAVIGQGSYGKVRLAHHSMTNDKFAVKVIEKAKLKSQKQINRLQREIRFLKLLYHPHIIKVYDVVETTDSIYIMMENASGGELFDYIVANKRINEKEARSFFRQVLSAVDYCHKNAVIHRDLKPENLLLDSNKSIKLVDFGFSREYCLDGKLLDTFCGSPFYAAPEMILGRRYAGPEVDMWSLGVVLFASLCGHLPFDDENIQKLYGKISSGAYVCPDFVNESAKHLIGRLITVDPKERATLREVLCHPWVMDSYDSTPPNYIPERQDIRNVNDLSKDIVRRLYAFGYKDVDIAGAFNENSDMSQPNAVRSTYHLLREMLCREEVKQQRLLKVKARGLVTSLDHTSPVRRMSLPMRDEADEMDVDPKSEFQNVDQSRTSLSQSVRPNINPRQVRELGSPIKIDPKELIDPMEIDATFQDTQLSNRPDSSLQRPVSSQPSSSAHKRRSSAAKIKEDLKVVSGWFMNVSTSSQKPLEEIQSELKRVSRDLGITVVIESDSLVHCEVNFDVSEGDLLGVNATEMQEAEAETNVKGRIKFQVEIRRGGKNERQYGLNFKRLQGGVWNFKKVSNRVIALMAL